MAPTNGRRTWLAAVTLAVTTALGCGPTQSDRVVTLWHQMRPGDRAVLEDRLADYEQATGVEVRAVYKETEELRSGLESAVLVGYGPDIVYGPSDPVAVYQEIGALQDLTPWLGAERDAFDPKALVDLPAFDDPGKQQLVFVGDRFGNHLALIYNRNLIEAPPKTTDELIELAKANTIDADGDGRPEQYGLVWNYTEPFFVMPFVVGYGAWIFEDAGPGEQPRPTLDTPELVAALEFVAGLRSKHKVLPLSADYEAAEALFKAGKAAMLINGDWSWQAYFEESRRQQKAGEEDAIDAAVAPLPVVSSTGVPMGGMVAPKGYSLSVAARGERADLAADVIRYLTGEETQQVYFDRQKVYPSRLALRDEAAIDADATLRASVEQINTSRLMPTATAMRATWDAMRPPYQQLMAGNLDAAEAARQMQSGAEQKIATLTTSIEPDATAPLVTVLGLAAFVGVVAWQWRGIGALTKDLKNNRLAYLLAGPAVLLIFLTVLFPLVFNVVLSFSNMSLQNFRDWQIVGLHNYQSLFAGDGAARFWGVFFKTIFWTVVNVALHVAIGVALAVTLNGPVRGKSFYRVALIIPWAVPAYITALTWRGMFDAEFGSVNQVLGLFGVSPINWLSDPTNAFAACIITNVWLGFPFMMLIALGGLQGIPQDLYEAARIDRATRWQQFTNITAPMLKPVMLPAITLGAVWTFNNLNVVWLVSNGGEPADQTHILVSYVYKAVFNLYQYGYGAALSMVIFGMLLLFSVLFLNRTKAVEGV
ncbi:MAG: extracellular solute-binding protein [Planctomycetota bacterium]